MESVKLAEAEYGGWGAGSVVGMLCVVLLLVFLPLGMAPGPLLLPSFSTLFILPVFMAAVLIFLSQASKTN